jgi:hypothetical protein
MSSVTRGHLQLNQKSEKSADNAQVIDLTYVSLATLAKIDWSAERNPPDPLRK